MLPSRYRFNSRSSFSLLSFSFFSMTATSFFRASRSLSGEGVSSEWMLSGLMNSSTRALQSRSFVSETSIRREVQFGFFEHAYFTTVRLCLYEADEYFACIGAEQTEHFKRPVAIYSRTLFFFRFAWIFC